MIKACRNQQGCVQDVDELAVGDGGLVYFGGPEDGAGAQVGEM
jgi:hypothetical protein